MDTLPPNRKFCGICDLILDTKEYVFGICKFCSDSLTLNKQILITCPNCSRFVDNLITCNRCEITCCKKCVMDNHPGCFNPDDVCHCGEYLCDIDHHGIKIKRESQLRALRLVLDIADDNKKEIRDYIITETAEACEELNAIISAEDLYVSLKKELE